MLGIDGQLRDAGAVDALTRYALERLRSGIGVSRKPSGR
jgi:hypothetical protein